MAEPTPMPVVLLPEESPLAGRLRLLLAEAHVDPGAVLVDCGHPKAATALAQFRAQQGGRRVALGIVAAGEAPPAWVDDFLRLEALEQELLPRLERLTQLQEDRDEARERQRDLSLLLELTARYAEALDVEALLHDVTKRLAAEMAIERASLVVLDEAQGLGLIVASSDDPSLKDLRIELSRYPEIREVLRTSAPVIIEDAPTHPLLEGVHRTVAERGIRNIAALPLQVSGKVLGVLFVRASGRRGAFSSQEIDFLTTVAHATAVALRNARLLESARGQNEVEKSARLAAEARARELTRYESYFAHISDGVVIIDEAGMVLSLNPAGSQMLEVPVERALGKDVSALARPEDAARAAELLRMLRRGEQPKERDIQVRTPSGNSLTLSISAAPLHEEGASAILSFRDVTEERRLADELHQTTEFLERLIDSSVDAIIAADMKGHIILFNKGAEAISGFTADEARATLNVVDLYPPGQAREVMSKLRSEAFGGRGRLTVTRQEFITKAGERVPVNMTASILYEAGQETATVGIFTDLRDRVQLERKLSDAEERLEESQRNAVIVALAGAAAHELNQPLTSVMGYAELLKRKLPPEDPSHRPIEVIHREAERMAEIVRKIGKITRYETKAYVGTAQILDLDKATSNDK